jgi:hypothetical protein
MALAGTTAVSLPLSHCSQRGDDSRPEFLYSLIGKSKTIEIGKAYVKRFPSESNPNKLTALISASLHEQHDTPADVRIQNEFRNGNIVVIDGWILSLTEARQSALYYLNTLS